MKIDEYKKLCEVIEMEEAKVENRKRPSYTAGNEDVLHNFKRDGELAGVDPMQNWLAHFLKQVAAIVSYVRNPDVLPSEPLLSRMVDIRVYAKLGMALAQDTRNKIDVTTGSVITSGSTDTLELSDEFIEQWNKNRMLDMVQHASQLADNPNDARLS